MITTKIIEGSAKMARRYEIDDVQWEKIKPFLGNTPTNCGKTLISFIIAPYLNCNLEIHYDKFPLTSHVILRSIFTVSVTTIHKRLYLNVPTPVALFPDFVALPSLNDQLDI